MRCDGLRYMSKTPYRLFQSTHLHEVRPSFNTLCGFLGVFQSTHLHEVRLLSLSYICPYNKFQSTHLHEVRPARPYICPLSGRCFNPRTYMRCDRLLEVSGNSEIVFQSTHLHEVRRPRCRHRWRQCPFQSTHLHEVRRIARSITRSTACFNPRTYMRCDFQGAF